MKHSDKRATCGGASASFVTMETGMSWYGIFSLAFAGMWLGGFGLMMLQMPRRTDDPNG